MKEKYQALVNRTIPISKELGWQIQSLDSLQIVTQTQITPNINIHGTVFAGSLFAAAMATGWTLLKCWSDENQFNADLVAAEANIQYLSPVDADFICISRLDKTSDAYHKLDARRLKNQSVGILQQVEIKCASVKCAILKIQFVFKCGANHQE